MPGSTQMEELYQQRLERYVTAMRNGVPDRVPIRPFAAEFTAKFAGYTAQQVTHDYRLAFDAVRQCARAFDWDAVVGNMVYVWTGLTQAVGLRYYAVPGIHTGVDTGFQYIEPSEDQAFMRPEEYDQLIEDPTSFLYNIWLPRVATEVAAPGQPNTLRNNLSFVKGGMAMLQYFTAFGEQAAALREECGMPSAIAGILKAPLDILADKLRGYLGLITDLRERPEKVMEACQALAPHLLAVALGGADPARQVPVTIWMHRGGVPFVSHEVFDSIYWPTLKPIIEGLWAEGHQTLFYAEGNWNPHLRRFRELPPGSIIYHVDNADIFEAHAQLGDRFALSGGIPNTVLSYGSPEEVRETCKRVLDGVAGEGGYICDASAIMQNDTSVENVRVMTDFVREYGVYGTPRPAPVRSANDEAVEITPSAAFRQTRLAPGVCFPWAEKRAELPPIGGDEALFERVWGEVDGLAYMYIWQLLESF